MYTARDPGNPEKITKQSGYHRNYYFGVNGFFKAKMFWF
jgi:hypothetical protein